MIKYDIKDWGKHITSKQSGIYYFYINDEIVYVGRARDLRMRMCGHFDIGHKWDQPHIDHSKITHVSFVIGEYDNEREEIKKYKPRWNILHNNRKLDLSDNLCSYCFKRHHPEEECGNMKESNNNVFKSFYKNKR